MNGKENYLSSLRHGRTEWTPVEGDGLLYCGFEMNQMEKGDFETGIDGFGVRWERPESGAGTALPAPGDFKLDSESIVDWRSIVSIPDPADYHWAADAAEQLAGVDRSATAVDYGDGNGPFERLAALMGFEEALVAMAVEPESTFELINAIADYKIACIDYIAEHFHPDTYTLYDDVCTQRAPFMAPETYRDMLLPANKRIVDAAKAYGMIPIRHNCGYGEPLVPYFIEEGYAAWASVQPCNDINAILARYGEQICIAGGYDTNGLPGTSDDPEVWRAEIERCFREYGGHPSYIFAGFILRSSSDLAEGESPWDATAALAEMAVDYARS